MLLREPLDARYLLTRLASVTSSHAPPVAHRHYKNTAATRRTSLFAAPVRDVENRALRRGLTITSSPWMIRTTAFESCAVTGQVNRHWR